MSDLNRLILHPDFEKTLRELRDRRVLPNEAETAGFSSFADGPSPEGKVVAVDPVGRCRLDANSGCSLYADFAHCAYDESWLKFEALEGTAFFTTHALVIAGKNDYLPVVLASFNFYTRSSLLTNGSPHIKYSTDVEVDHSRDYLQDKIAFLLEHVPEGSILLIDGPLIAGNLFTMMIDANAELLERHVIPVFIVKNSMSDAVTSNIEELKGKYNSDLHWVNTFLRRGDRSSFFMYQDVHNPRNSKVFSYLRAVGPSPQRVEFHTDTYSWHRDLIPRIMDMVYYLVLVQGSETNPQVRPVWIAEQYARQTLRYIDVKREFRRARITPTINQSRFGG